MPGGSDKVVGTRTLPTKPNLEFLKNTAKDRLSVLRDSVPEAKLADAQFALAQEYGYSSWRELKFAIDGTALALTDSTIPTPEDVARMRAEQSLPRTAIAIEPDVFDKYIGHYRLGACLILIVTREGARFFFEPAGSVHFELFPERPDKFFAKAIPAQISFHLSADGKVSELILHQNGSEHHAGNIDRTIALAIEKQVQERRANNIPTPETEQALRQHIDDIKNGRPNFATMSPSLAALVVVQFPTVQQYLERWGALKSVVFKAVGRNGADIYDVIFETGQSEWRISPLTADGKIDLLGFRDLP